MEVPGQPVWFKPHLLSLLNCPSLQQRVMRGGRGRRPAGGQGTMGLHCFLILSLFSCWAVGYKQGDNVTLYVNKVGPYHNPQETYHFYTLPVCRPEKVSLCSAPLL